MTLDKGETVFYINTYIYTLKYSKKNAVNKKLYFLKFGKIDSYTEFGLRIGSLG